jgi:hypothetical protein
MPKRALVFLGFGLGFAACSAGPSSLSGPSAGMAATRAQVTPEALSAAGEQELRAIVNAGRLADLQWPNFADHTASVKEFYEGTIECQVGDATKIRAAEPASRNMIAAMPS